MRFLDHWHLYDKGYYILLGKWTYCYFDSGPTVTCIICRLIFSLSSVAAALRSALAFFSYRAFQMMITWNHLIAGKTFAYLCPVLQACDDIGSFALGQGGDIALGGFHVFIQSEPSSLVPSSFDELFLGIRRRLSSPLCTTQHPAQMLAATA